MPNYKVIVVNHKVKILDPESWLSGLIKLFTWSKYNHSALYEVGETYFSTYVIEARAKGVVRVSWHDWLCHREKAFVIFESNIPIREDRVKESIGLKYDILSLFQQAFYIIFKIWLGRTDQKQLNCSEAIAWYYNLPKPYSWTAKKLFEYFK